MARQQNDGLGSDPRSRLTLGSAHVMFVEGGGAMSLASSSRRRNRNNQERDQRKAGTERNKA